MGKFPFDPDDDLPWGKFVSWDDETGEVNVSDAPPAGHKVDWWICPLLFSFQWRKFPDTEFGNCTQCKRAIVFRASTGAKNGNAPKICLECAQKLPIHK